MKEIYYVEKDCGENGIRYWCLTLEEIKAKKEQVRDAILGNYNNYFHLKLNESEFKKEFKEYLNGNLCDSDLEKPIKKALDFFKSEI